MRKSVAIAMMILFTSLYFAPVVNAVVSMSGETHICKETGKICKNKKMCMKKPRPKHGDKHAKKDDGKHVEAVHHASATSGHHDSHKKSSEAPKHKSCKERLSCGGGAGAFSIISKTLALDESLISTLDVTPLVVSIYINLYEDVFSFKDAPTFIPERPPKTS